MASCRFLELTFETNQGSFENHFAASPLAGGAWRTLKASVGLFQWLRPIDEVEWNQGSCVGYQESMLAVIQDSVFDIARVFSVIAVLMGMIVSLWGFFTSCLAWNWIQLNILRALLLVGAVTSGLSFFMLKADLCHGAIPNSTCSLDDGGWVLIAAVVLWVAAFIISVVFIRSFSPYDVEFLGTAAVGDVEKARRAGAMAAQRRSGGDSAQRAAQIKAEHERRRRRLQAVAAAASPTGTAKTSSPRTPDSLPHSSNNRHRRNNQGSFDSADSINSYQNRQRGVQYLQQNQQQQRARRQKANPAALTIDDVSSRNELEVYINEKMSRIKHLMDLSNADEDDDDNNTAAEV